MHVVSHEAKPFVGQVEAPGGLLSLKCHNPVDDRGEEIQEDKRLEVEGQVKRIGFRNPEKPKKIDNGNECPRLHTLAIPRRPRTQSMSGRSFGSRFLRGLSRSESSAGDFHAPGVRFALRCFLAQ